MGVALNNRWIITAKRCVEESWEWWPGIGDSDHWESSGSNYFTIAIKTN